MPAAPAPKPEPVIRPLILAMNADCKLSVLPLATKLIFLTARHERGLSQRQLAKILEVPRSYISKVENGHIFPYLGSVERYARGLRLPMRELMARIDVLCAMLEAARAA
jgi:predicted transcriptional regulator